MKLVNVKIHNFRGILEQEIAFFPYTLLVGPNNAGKSTFIDAIRAFYEKDGFKFKADRDFPFLTTEDRDSWIEMTFELAEEEHSSLKTEYQTPARTLRVRKWFHTEHKADDGKTSVAGCIYAYAADGQLSTEQFYGAKNVQSGKFGDVIYIPAVSRVDDHTKLSGPSALRDLLEELMNEVVKAGTAYSDFSKSVDTFAEAIQQEKTSDQRSLGGFQEKLNELLEPWQTRFSLQFPTPSAGSIIKQMVGYHLLDQFHGKPQDVGAYGSGFQRNFIYCLIRLATTYVGKKQKKKGKDFAPLMTLILFEEPEAFLHPPQQNVLARSLMEASAKDIWQVVSTTHSSHFVSRNTEAIPAIVRVTRSGGTVQAFQIRPGHWLDIVNANQAIAAIASKYASMKQWFHTDDIRPEMEAVKYFLWLNADRCGVFFASHALLVEGPTEVALINKLISDGGIAEADTGVYVMDCLGKYNIHRFMGLLSALGISHSVIHDGDNNRKEHAELNELIQTSKHDKFTAKIVVLPDDLETLLGVSAPGSPHRKPQHMLLQYSEGNLDDMKVREFCKLIESCLPQTVKDQPPVLPVPLAAAVDAAMADALSAVLPQQEELASLAHLSVKGGEVT